MTRRTVGRLRAVGASKTRRPSARTQRGSADNPLTRLLVYATQLEIEAGDPLFPSFVRHQDPHNQWGGPNPDNVYLQGSLRHHFSTTCLL